MRNRGGQVEVPVKSRQWLQRIGMAAAIASMALVPLAAQNGSAGTGHSRQAFGGAMGRGGFGPPGGGVVLERLDRELSFTDAQKTQIQTLLTDERAALKATFAAVMQAQQALDAAILQSPADGALLQARVNDVATIHAQLQLARAQVESKIFQLLTADQQQKAQQLVAQMESRRSDRSGR
jgi:Spy/CpxP family protein refolding chaperone